MLFNRFDELTNALDEYTRPSEEIILQGFSAIAHMMLDESQRFYVPSAAYIIEEKIFDSQMQRMMNLPFDNVALLSETHLRATDTQTWKITLAVNPSGKSRTSAIFKSMLEATLGAEILKRRGWVICSMLRAPTIRAIRPKTHGWAPVPLAYAFCSFPNDRDGYEINLLPAMDHGITTEELAFELQEDIAAIQNLCALLALKNVKTATINPSMWLNRKRAKHGSKSLYSYHILEVDGEKWDRNEISGSKESGIRSHFRRGHIRHLSEEKSVWVRATMVKGSVRGFVDKDYRLNLPA